MTVNQIILEDNATMKKLYPSGQNHKGQKLAYYKVAGHNVWAINADQAKNIHHQATVDAL